MGQDTAQIQEIRKLVSDAVSAAVAQLQSRGAQTPNLSKAYVAAWSEIQNVVKNSHNPHFNSNFADLSAVLDTGKPVFAKHGLALFQTPGPMVGEKISLPGLLMHESGESISFTTELPIGAKSTAQAAGSAITYARRYQAAAVFGLTAVDDDGNQATAAPPAEVTATPKKEKADKPARAEKAQAADTYAATKEILMAKIGAATERGPDGSTTDGHLAALKESVTELNDKDVVDAYIARRKVLKK